MESDSACEGGNVADTEWKEGKRAKQYQNSVTEPKNLIIFYLPKMACNKY